MNIFQTTFSKMLEAVNLEVIKYLDMVSRVGVTSTAIVDSKER